jgi:hypothetical protein
MEEEFLQKYQMHQSNFNELVSLISKIILCFTPTQNIEQAKPEHQVLLFLYYLGKTGSKWRE